MNWGRAKTILIVLFLAIDILLLTLLMVVNHDVMYIKEDTILSTISVLNSHEIRISKDCIPKKRNKKVILNYENLAYTHEKAAERFLGDAFEVESEENFVKYKNENASLKISGSEVLYEEAREINPSESFEQIKETLISDLKKLGYEEKNISFENIKIENGICHATLCMMYDGKKVSGAEMNLEVDADGLLKLSGRCFSFSSAKDTEEKMIDVTSALCSMIYNPEYFGLTIEKVEIIYYIDSEYIDGSDVAAYPVYVVTDGEGQQHILREY